MLDLLRLVVMMPAETVLDVRGVRWVRVGLADGGSISIWPGHAPLLGETVPGDVRYAAGSDEHSVSLGPGVLHVARGRVTIYTARSVSYGTEEDGHSGGAQQNHLQPLAATLPGSVGSRTPGGTGSRDVGKG